MFRFMPREGRFFEYFSDISDLIVEASQELSDMFKDLAHAESHARKIKELEHRADEITHKTVGLLHTTFITPIDREDIHQLITQLDDILDYLEATSERINLYGVTSMSPEATELADISARSARIVRTAVKGISNLKESEKILKDCVEINRLENEADHVLRNGMAKLFREESDVRRLLMMKELYELLETVTDRCEDVANTVEGIVLEYA